jgi:mannose-6-phosphate isomerase-like protein (cupin superfamily)
MAYHINIEKATLHNNNYRKVLITTKNSQLVLMSLKPNMEIGLEIHPENDQFIRIEKGTGRAIITNKKKEILQNIKLSDGSALTIPRGTYHNIINTGETPLKLYTIYSPANHPANLIEKNKPLSEL